MNAALPPPLLRAGKVRDALARGRGEVSLADPKACWHVRRLMAPLKLTHVFSYFRSLGGVQEVLKHHHTNDARFGFDSRMIVYFEDATEPVPRVDFLGLTGQSSISLLRARAAAALAKHPPELVVYHGMWGMNHLAGLDRARRRFLMHHGIPLGTESLFSRRSRFFDGVLCVSRPLCRIVQQTAPHLDEHRTSLMPLPITVPSLRLAQPARRPADPLRLGFCGRLTMEQKRIDRLPKLFASLDAAGLDYRMEFLGDGSDRAWLEGRCADQNRFQFHGRLSGEAYWRVLQSWDAILFVSDYEGTPIALLEALSQGVIPVYPRIDSGGEDYADRIRPGLAYAPDDFNQVARVLREIRELPPEQMHALRQGCQESIQQHLGDHYLEHFSKFVRSVMDLPAVAQSRSSFCPFPLDRLSFATLERLSHFRRRLRG